MRSTLTLVLLFVATLALGQNTHNLSPSLRTAFSQPVPGPQVPAWMAPADSTNRPDGCHNQCCAGCFNGDIKYNLILDSRRTFLSGEAARMNGLRVGAELFEKVRFGFGFYNLQNPVDISDRIDDDGDRTRTLDFNYTTTYLEYIAYRDFRWELSLPVQYGLGTGRVDTTNVAGISGLEREDGVSIFTVGAAGYVRLIPWFGLGAGTGYVFAGSENRVAGRAFSAPYYTIRVKIFLGHLLKAMFAPAKLEEEMEEYRRERDARRNKSSL